MNYSNIIYLRKELDKIKVLFKKGEFKLVIQKSKTEVPSPEQFPDRNINQKKSAVNTDGGILHRKTSFSSNLLDYAKY